MLRVFDKAYKHISVSHRCGCALTFLPMAKRVLSQYMKSGVFVCYSSAGSESVIVNYVKFV